MLKKENPESPMRCKFLEICDSMDIPASTIVKMTECMRGRTVNEVEELAERLTEIVLTSSTESEMVSRAMKLRGNTQDSMSSTTE